MKNLTLVIEKKFILRDLLQQIIIISGIFICSSTVARSPLKCPNVKHYNIGVLLLTIKIWLVCMYVLLWEKKGISSPKWLVSWLPRKKIIMALTLGHQLMI